MAEDEGCERDVVHKMMGDIKLGNNENVLRSKGSSKNGKKSLLD